MITIREAATLMGCSRRTVRSRVARGDLPGEMRNGRWYVDRRHIPLTEEQRRAYQSKAEKIRKAVEDILPSRSARTYGQRHRSAVDLDAFRLGSKLLADIRTDTKVVPEEIHHVLTSELEQALLAVAEAAHQYDRELKLNSLNRARSELARAAGRMLLMLEAEGSEALARWLDMLEGEVLPAVAGYSRWVEGLTRRRRR